MISGNLLHIVSATKVFNFVYSTYHWARQTFSWELSLYLPNEERIYMAIRKSLILLRRCVPIIQFFHGSVCCWQWRVGVILHLPSHSTGLEEVGVLHPGQGGCPWALTQLCLQSEKWGERARNTIKRKQELASRAGGLWVNKHRPYRSLDAGSQEGNVRGSPNICTYICGGVCGCKYYIYVT